MQDYKKNYCILKIFKSKSQNLKVLLINLIFVSNPTEFHKKKWSI